MAQHGTRGNICTDMSVGTTANHVERRRSFCRLLEGLLELSELLHLRDDPMTHLRSYSLPIYIYPLHFKAFYLIQQQNSHIFQVFLCYGSKNLVSSTYRKTGTSKISSVQNSNTDFYRSNPTSYLPTHVDVVSQSPTLAVVKFCISSLMQLSKVIRAQKGCVNLFCPGRSSCSMLNEFSMYLIMQFIGT